MTDQSKPTTDRTMCAMCNGNGGFRWNESDGRGGVWENGEQCETCEGAGYLYDDLVPAANPAIYNWLNAHIKPEDLKTHPEWIELKRLLGVQENER